MRVFEHVVVETASVVRLDLREDGSLVIEVKAPGQRLKVEVAKLERLELAE